MNPSSLATAKEALDQEKFFERLLKKDQTLFGPAPLGWVDVSAYEKEIPQLQAFAQEIKAAGFTDVACLGMGGSSLTAGILFEIFGPGNGQKIHVLDTTHPGMIRNFENSVLLEKTLFIVASKTGSTIESVVLQNYFLEKLRALKGSRAGENFVAITDENTILAQAAHRENFRKTFINATDIGGRYSALSFFGLVPAALLGIDLKKLMQGARAEAVKERAFDLGIKMGVAALEGQDKLTLRLPPAVKALGLWIEQILAESTGKDGKGIVPLHLSPTSSTIADGLTISVEADPYDLGREFLTWEIATVVAGRILQINPLDQPNVQQSKDFTQVLLAHPSPSQIHDERETLISALKNLGPQDYVGLMAFTMEDAKSITMYQQIREWIETHLHRPTTLGFGPRFLHSTGQLHKGGPKTGLFIQFDYEETQDLPIPGKPFTFDGLKKAQSQGDYLALKKSGQRVFAIQLGSDPEAGLQKFIQFLQNAL